MVSEKVEDLASDLAALSRDPRRDWPRIGELLGKVDATEAWRESAANFTEWMRDVAAPACGLKEASVWRYLRASRIYMNLRRELSERSMTLPPLKLLSPKVSAENLELLDKLRRVAPREITESIARRLVNGQVPRDEIRSLWADYRPAMLGRTAQGRGVKPPKVDRRIPETDGNLTRAYVLSALRRGGAEWTGDSEPEVYSVFADVELPSKSLTKEDQRCTVDAVVVVRSNPSATVEFHGVHVRADADSRTVPPWLESAIPYFTKLWIVSAAQEMSLFRMEEATDVFGSLSAEAGRLVVCAEPQPLPGMGSRTGDLAVELLVTLAKSKK